MFDFTYGFPIFIIVALVLWSWFSFFSVVFSG